MTEPAVRRYHLPILKRGVSWVDAGSYPDAGGCHIICLSDRQCAIIRDMVGEKATWPARFAVHLHGEIFTFGDPLIFQEHVLEVNELFEQIGEGSSVACTELVTALSDLAAALSAAQAGSGGQNIINCGSGCGTGVAGATGGLISGLTYEELAGPGPIVEPDPQGDPPAGFETWEAYRTLKCQGAYYVFDTMVRAFNVLNTLSGVLGSLATVTPMIMYYLAATTAVAPLIDVVAIALAVIPFLVLAIGAAYSTASAIAYLEDNKDIIICAMYRSGSAQEVIEIAANAIEDAVQTVEWKGLLSGLGSTLAPAMATAASSMITTNVVNAMFHLVEDVVYPAVNCDICDETSGMPWHFTNNAQGWYWDDETPPSGWSYTAVAVASDPADPNDIDAGSLYASVTSPGNSDWYPRWVKQVDYLNLTANTGEQLRADVRVDTQTGADWYLLIIYEDETNDSHEWLNTNMPTTWEQRAVSVSSDNNGKMIKRFEMCCRVYYPTAGTVQYWMDNVSYS